MNLPPKKTNQGGFVALFAVLLSVIVLAMSIGISNISYKEMVLTSAAREANYSFFAADSGAECALYYDLPSQTHIFTDIPGGNNPTILYCAGLKNVPVFVSSHNQYPSDSTDGGRYEFELNNSASCARVVVLKNVEMIDPDGTVHAGTRIESKGYNMDCDTVNSLISSGSSSSRLVERAVRASYADRTVSTGTGGGSGGPANPN